ncbi:MAG: WecB/TagA/CpsF family glycosyltransferase [Candidatus Nanopelagicales bacterium]|nr:WecB/TagA/CpsF family glycosyltransferase [Candidatus Nanopelagicales bacterium]MDZ4248971.1 WecB/TagA/CpsF family glycosyltransferase [Candidatus Nanopelagicales bacterium]
MTNPLLELPCAEVGRVPFRVAPMSQVVSAVLDASQEPGPSPTRLTAGGRRPQVRGIAVHFANAYTVALADADDEYARVLRGRDSAVFSDGVPVVWAGRRLHRRSSDEWQQVRGSDVMEAVLAASSTIGPRHYLLGGTRETVDRLSSVIRLRFPNADIVGVESPPFRAQSHEEQFAQDKRIADSGAQIVWVGLGTPKQDWEVARLSRSLPVVAIATGAAFDFIAGAKPQAPKWMRASGLEWAYRLGTEPRRLWRRYLWGNPRFLIAAARTPRQSRTRRR